MSFWSRLFTSPEGRPLRNSPFAFYLIGVLCLASSLDGLRTGRMHLRSRVVERADSPEAFLFAVAALLACGVAALVWGGHVWRRHGPPDR